MFGCYRYIDNKAWGQQQQNVQNQEYAPHTHLGIQ